MDNNSEMIALLTNKDEQDFNNQSLPSSLPILSLRNTVLFPGVVIPLTIGREKSIQLINDYKNERLIGVIAQKDSTIEDPTLQDLYTIGTVAQVMRVITLPDGTTNAIIQGKKRFVLNEAIQTNPYYIANVSNFIDVPANEQDQDYIATMSSIKDMAVQIIKNSPTIPQETIVGIQNIESRYFLLNFICSNMNASVEEKQRILSIADAKEQAQQVLAMLDKELQMVKLKGEIQNKVRTDLDQQQREYLLNQQLKKIQEELGGNQSDKLMKEFQEKAATKKWNETTALSFYKELERLKRLNINSPEYGVHTNYLELLLDLPWNEYTEDTFDLNNAESILEEDHFGLKKVKERILEYLAVLKLKNDMKSPILCLYGPPGVGKTSLGKSIAASLGRKYVRMSLGGLRDESEIRGHRKTYIGAMPGRIIQNIKKAQTSNPVFILDEIDKLGADYRGDPSSALLEVLDPEQNSTFYDNYLEMDYDLSKVMFIATSNSLSSIQPALLDRMEIIEVTGYTTEEKMVIAQRHLIPKQIKEHGLLDYNIHIESDAIRQAIAHYTKESGVRGLDKTMAKIVRHIAKLVAMDKPYPTTITSDLIPSILGIPSFIREKHELKAQVGVVTGLAWTPVGGEILFIETSLSKGDGQLTLTGNLGNVMKESATLALGYIKANAEKLGLTVDELKTHNIHLHVPEGATPKDGPSAGITIFTALISCFTDQKVKGNIAMTGEITLRGKVLPVGGIKEKILAAKRVGIDTIILSEMNRKDIQDIEDLYLQGLTFHYVSNMVEVLEIALVKN